MAMTEFYQIGVDRSDHVPTQVDPVPLYSDINTSLVFFCLQALELPSGEIRRLILFLFSMKRGFYLALQYPKNLRISFLNETANLYLTEVAR